jgi:hypothetical protein
MQHCVMAELPMLMHMTRGDQAQARRAQQVEQPIS